MDTSMKLSRREKAKLIWKYLRPVVWYFAVALICACLAMVFNALTPQVIKITVDSILGTQEPELPAILLRWVSVEALRMEPVRGLWLAAIGVMLTALLRGICSFGQRLNLSKGSEGFVKGIRTICMIIFSI